MFLLYNSLYFVFENFYHKRVLKNLLCPFFSWDSPRNRKVNLTSKSLPGCICLIFTLPVPVTLRHSVVPFQIWTHLSSVGIPNVSSDFWEFTFSTNTRPPIAPWPLPQNEVSNFRLESGGSRWFSPRITGINFSPQTEMCKKQYEHFL